MKKILALILAAVMLLCSCTAMADTEKHNIAFDDSVSFNVVLPDGYTCDEDVTEGVLMALISKDEDSYAFELLIAPDADNLDVARLNDLSDEDKAACAEALMGDWGTDWSLVTTGEGTELIEVRTNADDYEMLMLVTIYAGYDVALYMAYEDGRALSDEDVAQAVQFFTDMEFVQVQQ